MAVTTDEICKASPMAMNNANALKRIMHDRTLRVWLMSVIDEDLRLNEQSYTRERAAEICALRQVGMMLLEDMRKSNFKGYQIAEREYRDLKLQNEEYMSAYFDNNPFDEVY